MSNNFNALLNAAIVATHHHVTAAVGTTSTHAAAAQGDAAAARGAAAQGAAGVAAGNVATAVGSGTAQQWLATQSRVAFAPGNSSVPLPHTQPAYVAGQPASPTGLASSNGAALGRTDSTTEVIEAQGNGEDCSMHMGGSVDDPLIQHFPRPLFVDSMQILAKLPSVFTASRPPPPVDIPEILPHPPIIVPACVFAPRVRALPAAAVAPSTATAVAVLTALAAKAGSSMHDVDTINARAANALRDLEWRGPGERAHRAHAHHITPDDCQTLLRLVVHRNRGDRPLLEAEARNVANKNEQLILLKKLRKHDLSQPPHRRENFVTGAELDLKFQICRLRAALQLAAVQAAFVASAFFPEEPPVPLPPPPPHSNCSVMAGAVMGPLECKRDADDEPEGPPAARAGMEQEQEPQLRFAFLRSLHVQPPPRPHIVSVAATHPEPLPYSGAPVLYSMSDFAMQTDEDSLSPVAAVSPCNPASRTPRITNVGVAGPSRQRSKAPLTRTPFLVAAGAHISTVSPPRPERHGKDRRVEFKPCVSIARPRRFTSPPPPPMVGTEDDDEHKTQQPVGGAVSRGLLTPAQLAALGVRGKTVTPTIRTLWSHPDAKYATYKDAGVQYGVPEPELKLAPKPKPVPTPKPALKLKPALKPTQALKSSTAPSPSLVAATGKKSASARAQAGRSRAAAALKQAAVAAAEQMDRSSWMY